eukprot:scaffold11094_cov176-Amphora_coffeaeformis.AAC.6
MEDQTNYLKRIINSNTTMEGGNDKNPRERGLPAQGGAASEKEEGQRDLLNAYKAAAKAKYKMPDRVPGESDADYMHKRHNVSKNRSKFVQKLLRSSNGTGEDDDLSVNPNSSAGKGGGVSVGSSISDGSTKAPLMIGNIPLEVIKALDLKPEMILKLLNEQMAQAHRQDAIQKSYRDQLAADEIRHARQQQLLQQQNMISTIRYMSMNQALNPQAPAMMSQEQTALIFGGMHPPHPAMMQHAMMQHLGGMNPQLGGLQGFDTLPSSSTLLTSTAPLRNVTTSTFGNATAGFDSAAATPEPDRNDDVFPRLAHRTLFTPKRKVAPGLMSTITQTGFVLGDLKADDTNEGPAPLSPADPIPCKETRATLMDLCRVAIPFFTNKETNNPALSGLQHVPATIDIESFLESDDPLVSVLFADGDSDLVKKIVTICNSKNLQNRLAIAMGEDVRLDLEVCNVLEMTLAFQVLEELGQQSWDDIPYLLQYKESLNLDGKLKHTAEGQLILEVLQNMATETSSAKENRSAAMAEIPDKEPTKESGHNVLEKESAKTVKRTGREQGGSTLLSETRSSKGKRVTSRGKNKKPDFGPGRS